MCYLRDFAIADWWLGIFAALSETNHPWRKFVGVLSANNASMGLVEYMYLDIVVPMVVEACALPHKHGGPVSMATPAT